MAYLSVSGGVGGLLVSAPAFPLPRFLVDGYTGELAEPTGAAARLGLPCTPAGGTAGTEGTSVGSSPVSVTAGLGQYIGAVVARRGFHGPQVVVTWEAPSNAADVSRMVVLRRRLAWPTDEADGALLYDGPPVGGSAADLDVPDREPVYYAVWALVTPLGRWVTHPRGRAQVVPLATGFYGRRLWDLLPPPMRTDDQFAGVAEPPLLELVALVASGGTITEAPLDAERFNFNPTLGQLGPLRRYLEVHGPLLDEVRGLLLALLNQLDPRVAIAGNLHLLAEFLGFRLDRGLPVARQRQRILTQVPLLQIKGTVDGVAALAVAVTGYPARVRDVCRNLWGYAGNRQVGSGRPSSTTSPESWRRRPGPLGLAGVEVTVEFPSCTAGCLTQDTAATLRRELVDFLDVCALFALSFEDGSCPEPLDPLLDLAYDVEFV